VVRDFRAYEREPRARQLAQTLVSVANLTRAALVSARIPNRAANCCASCPTAKASTSIRQNPATASSPCPTAPFCTASRNWCASSSGPHTRLTLEREGERALFLSFRIDDSDDGDYWLALPRERIERVFPLGWLGWGVAALLLSLLGAWLIVFRITRPLKALQQARRGKSAPAPRRRGSTKAARPNWPPWPRLQPDERRPGADRPGSGADPGRHLARLAHAADAPAHGHRNGRRRVPARRHDADVEEMDKTIGQFLDFARSEGGEAPQEVDVAALLAEISPANTGGAALRSMCRDSAYRRTAGADF
jgi:two-component system osmolarity sensor histidine kinase EnvZ